MRANKLLWALPLTLTLLTATALAAGEHGAHSTDSGWMALMETTTELSSGSYYLSGNVAYRGVAPSPSAAMLPSASTAMSST